MINTDSEDIVVISIAKANDEEFGEGLVVEARFPEHMQENNPSEAQAAGLAVVDFLQNYLTEKTGDEPEDITGGITGGTQTRH